MRRYESYKDSGVEWLGEVPSHWELGRISTYFTERRTKVSDKDYPALSVTKLGVFPQWENVAKTNDGDNRKLARKGDFVINSRSDRKGSSGIAKQDGSVSLINIVLQPKKINSVYSEYLFKSYSFIEEFYRVGHGIVADLWTTRFEDIKNSLIIFPPLSEQQKIAQFLDDKTAKIDQAVDLAEKQIALLKEHKQILIQNAVTRGLNPDVPLKDSGVEWIGQVPEHWEVVSMKRVIKEHSGNGFPIDLQGNNGSIPFLKVSDFSENQDKYIFKWNNSVTNKVIKQKKWNIVPKNSIVTAKIGEALRKNHRKILSIDSIIDNNCLGIEIKKADVLFGYYLHCALDFDLFTNPGAIPSLAMDKYRNQKIALPPFQEQQQITDYLDAQTAKIDQAIALKTAHIEKLKEYKNVLINDVVTGKVRVSV